MCFVFLEFLSILEKISSDGDPFVFLFLFFLSSISNRKRKFTQMCHKKISLSLSIYHNLELQNLFPPSRCVRLGFFFEKFCSISLDLILCVCVCVCIDDIDPEEWISFFLYNFEVCFFSSSPEFLLNISVVSFDDTSFVFFFFSFLSKYKHTHTRIPLIISHRAMNNIQWNRDDSSTSVGEIFFVDK